MPRGLLAAMLLSSSPALGPQDAPESQHCMSPGSYHAVVPLCQLVREVGSSPHFMAARANPAIAAGAISATKATSEMVLFLRLDTIRNVPRRCSPRESECASNEKPQRVAISAGLWIGPMPNSPKENPRRIIQTDPPPRTVPGAARAFLRWQTGVGQRLKPKSEPEYRNSAPACNEPANS